MNGVSKRPLNFIGRLQARICPQFGRSDLKEILDMSSLVAALLGIAWGLNWIILDASTATQHHYWWMPTIFDEFTAYGDVGGVCLLTFAIVAKVLSRRLILTGEEFDVTIAKSYLEPESEMSERTSLTERQITMRAIRELCRTAEALSECIGLGMPLEAARAAAKIASRCANRAEHIAAHDDDDMDEASRMRYIAADMIWLADSFPKVTELLRYGTPVSTSANDIEQVGKDAMQRSYGASHPLFNASDDLDSRCARIQGMLSELPPEAQAKALSKLFVQPPQQPTS